MNVIALLLALLVVAYIGSRLAVARGVRGYSLPSGVEYAVLGAVLGPQALGVVERGTLAAMAPAAVVALGWIALEQGVECGFVGAQRAPWTRQLLGGGLGVLLSACIFGFVYWVLGVVTEWVVHERALIGFGAALVSCESTRHGLRWIKDHEDHGPLGELIADVSSADVAMPLTALSIWFSLASSDAAAQPWWSAPVLWHAAGTLGLGVVLALIVVTLLQATRRAVDAWGVLLGGALVGVGVSHGLGAAWLTTLFSMGVTLALFDRHRERVRAKLEKTEHPVLLPVLALAGAHVDVSLLPELLVVPLAALVARAAFTVVVAAIGRRVSPTVASGGMWLGPSMLSSGALTICLGFACVLHVPGLVGQAVLLAAITDTLVGELVGPTALRAALRHAGEWTERSSDRVSTPVPMPSATSSGDAS